MFSMIAVVVTLCHPGKCVVERRVVEGTPMACQIGLLQQEVIAEIILRYPGWSVAEHHCEPPDGRRL